jgi:predicted MFS family arabinose efflux permease
MPEAPDAQHRRAVTLLSVAAFASAAAARLCDPLLPDLARSFATTPTAAASVISSFAIAYGLTQALFGIGGLSYILAAKHLVRRLGEVGLATAGIVLMLLVAAVGTPLVGGNASVAANQAPQLAISLKKL